MNKKIIIITSLIILSVIALAIILIPSEEVIECDSLISPNQNIIINLCDNFDVSFYGANQSCTFWNVNNKIWNVCDGGIIVK